MKFLCSMVWARYLTSLKMASLFVLAVNVLVPVLALIFAEARPYAFALLAVHISPFLVQHIDHPMDVQFIAFSVLSLIIVASIVAGLDLAILGRRVIALPIRISLCAFWYALVLGLVWFLALAVAAR